MPKRGMGHRGGRAREGPCRTTKKKGSERGRRAEKKPRGAARRPASKEIEPLGEGEAQALYAAFDRTGRGSILPSDVKAMAERFGLQMPGDLLGDMLAFAGGQGGQLSPEQFHVLLGRIEAAGQLRM